MAQKVANLAQKVANLAHFGGQGKGFGGAGGQASGDARRRLAEKRMADTAGQFAVVHVPGGNWSCGGCIDYRCLHGCDTFCFAGVTDWWPLGCGRTTFFRTGTADFVNMVSFTWETWDKAKWGTAPFVGAVTEGG